MKTLKYRFIWKKSQNWCFNFTERDFHTQIIWNWKKNKVFHKLRVYQYCQVYVYYRPRVILF